MSRSGTEVSTRAWRRVTSGLLASAVLAAGGLALEATTTAAPTASASTSSTVTITGRGWGHGRGLGQYGSLGYATDHRWTYQQILNHFYGGTTAGTQPNDVISVQLTRWTGNTVAVTSANPFRVGNFGAPGAHPMVGAGSLAEISRGADGKWYMLAWEGGCNRTGGPYGPYEIGGPIIEPSAPGDTAGSLLTLCGATEQRSYRGAMRMIATTSGSTTITHLLNDVPMETYLRGVVPRESPASWGSVGATDPGTGKPWGFHALAAQAVAARSYAFGENRSPGNWKTCDTTSCQVYGGAFLNGTAIEDSRTDSAIATTAGVVRRMPNGTIARTEFSSSTGGWTAGGTFPAVQDAGDAVASNPNHNWQTSISTAAVEAAYPSIGSLVRFDVTKRNGLGADGGRVTEMKIVGTSSTVTVTGNQFRSALGLKADWFTPQNPQTTQDPNAPTPAKVTMWSLRNVPSTGAADAQMAYGGSPAESISCDWDGNGTDTLGVYVGNTWYLRNSTSAGPPDITVSYGAPGYQPVCGDWDGNGTDTIGVYVGDTWYLRNSNTPGPPDLTITYGYAGTRAVVGDWDGNGSDTIGVFANGSWFLRNSNTPGPPSASVTYGGPTDVPVVGDWDGNKTDTIGVYVFDTWYLRDDLKGGSPTRTIRFGGAGTRPTPGNWDGIGGAGVGFTSVQ